MYLFYSLTSIIIFSLIKPIKILVTLATLIITNQIDCMLICSVFKDKKEPKNLSLKEDFASQRSPIQ